MKINQNDIDIDNFIKEKINSRRFYDPIIEPSPEFARRAMSKIYRLERRKYFTILCSSVIILALFPLAIIKHFWFFAGNDYFSLSNFPFGDLIVPVYQFLLSFVGNLLLVIIGIALSLLFVLKSRYSKFSHFSKFAKIA